MDETTQNPDDPLAAVRDEIQKQQDELDQKQQDQFALMRARNQQAQGGLGNSSSPNISQFMQSSPASAGIGSAGAAGFTGGSMPAIGAGTGEGASGLFGLGGSAEMAGGSTGSGLFTLGGAGEGAGASSAGLFSGGSAAAGAGSAAGGGAASGGFGSAVAAGGPYAALVVAAIAGRQYMINTGREKQSDILTGQGAVRHLGYLGDKIDNLPAGKPLGKQVAALGKMMSLRPSGFKDHIVASMPWNMVKDIFH